MLKLIAHRGASTLALENTKAAFEIAGKSAQVFGIETDIWKTTDNVWVCSHDNNPFVDKTILINQSKYSDIQKLPLSITKPKFNTDQKNYLCTLDDYLDVCQKFDKAPIIEIKSNDLTNADCVVLSNKIHKRGLFEKTAFISFEFDSLKTLRTAMPKITIYDLIDTKLAKNGLGKSGVKVSINLNHNVSVRSCLATKKIVKLAHEHHLLISIWTVDKVRCAHRYKHRDVDFITTNNINLFT